MRAARRGRVIVTALLALGSLAAVAVPAFLIHPFKTQTLAQVRLSHFLRSVSPALTAICLVVAVVLVARNLRRDRWPARIAGGASVLVLAACTWFSRQNHFEWMFAPMPHPTFTRGDVGFLGPSDLVLAVDAGGEAAAYPVRILAYHHLVMDAVGGVPIVATY